MNVFVLAASSPFVLAAVLFAMPAASGAKMTLDADVKRIGENMPHGHGSVQ